MINNEWHIIGTCVSNFEVLGNKKFVCYTLRIEVEKFGGKFFDVDVLVYSTNKAINTSKNYLGKLVAVNGYIDSFVQDKGGIILKLVAQNIKELTASAKVETYAKSEEKPSMPNMVEDDLPF